jgi:hypothetical protein
MCTCRLYLPVLVRLTRQLADGVFQAVLEAAGKYRQDGIEGCVRGGLHLSMRDVDWEDMCLFGLGDAVQCTVNSKLVEGFDCIILRLDKCTIFYKYLHVYNEQRRSQRDIITMQLITGFPIKGRVNACFACQRWPLRTSPSSRPGCPNSSILLYFDHTKNERFTYNTRRRKPCSPSRQYITPNSRSDLSSRSRRVPATTRHLLLRQPMAATQRNTSTRAATSTRNIQANRPHTYTADRRSSSLQTQCIRQQQQPHA